MSEPHSPEFVRQVRELAGSATLTAVLSGLSDHYQREWRQTRPDQADTREHLWRMIQAVEGVAAEIKSIARSDEKLSATIRAPRRIVPLAF